jgi:adenosylmethionine-8-amino-7-oxononanoate aminotransferase
MFEPLLFDVIRLPIPDPRRLPAGVAPNQAAEHYLAPLQSALAAQHDEIAALVIEPLVQCAAGIVIHPTGYLRGVRELTRKYDVLMIADEVASGMGRTGTLFACEQEDVVPDFLCLGKGITGGYLPLSATMTNDEIYGAFLGEFADFKTLFHGHTYGGNALAAAAALATLDVFEQERTLEILRPKIARLGEHLCRLAEHSHVANARQRGFLGAVDLVRDKSSGEPYPWTERRGFRAGREAMRHGVWLRPLGDTIYVMPPLAISMDDLDRIMEVVGLIDEAATKESSTG